MLNKYFTENQEGQEVDASLFQCLATEYVQQHGIDVWYIKRDSQRQDVLLNEDPLASFTEAVDIEMYLGTFEGYNGVDNDLIAGFGFQLNDRAEFYVSSVRFKEELGMDTPREGDLIWMPKPKTLMVIKYQDPEEVFYHLGNTPFYKIHAEIFDYSGEDFNTGLEEVDLLDIDLTSNEEIINTQEQVDNDLFDTTDDDLIDFSEDNPFGIFGRET